MSFSQPIKVIDASDDEIRRALADAQLPSLLPAVAHATGDLSVLRPELRVDPLMASLPQGGLTDEQQAGIREVAFAALRAFRDSGSHLAPAPDEERLLAIMDYTVAGAADMTAYLPLLLEELAPKGEDLRRPDWHVSRLAPGTEFRVVVIGAGMSGLLTAHRLRQAGVDVVILEKNPDLGGTWWENTYPGCRVDNPSHMYSYSFAQRDDWPFHHSPQPVLLEYFRSVAEEFALAEAIRFGQEVTAATWREDTQRWVVDVRTSDGTTSTIEANVVVSAVGQLNRPKLPDIEGLDTFAGPSFHSARWNHEVDLSGKRVAVIGNGASAAQFIPIVAEQAGELTVFQRTPNWFFPSPDYHEPVAEGLRWLYGHVPYYSQWTRFWIFYRLSDGMLPAVSAEADWTPVNGSISAANDFLRQVLQGYIEAEFADRPDLLPKVVPHYPVGAKRVVVDNGIWARTLKRPNVTLETGGIERITPTGIVTADGVAHDFDVIICGTGFQASKFLTPMRITGRDGADLHEQWAGDARAYLGVTVPNFPNLFCLYGPNTNIVVHGSIIYFSECGARYVTGLVKLLLEGRKSLEIRPEVHDAFNEYIDRGNRAMSWGVAEVSSWYKNETGRVAQNWPYTLIEYWQRTKHPVLDDYLVS